MKWTPRFTVWAIALVLVTALRFATPCGCLGLTILRPSAETVRQMPNSCAVLHTPSHWVDEKGKRFDPEWANADTDRMNLGERWQRVHYAVWRSAGGIIVGMATPESDRRSGNSFLLQKDNLVSTGREDWRASVFLPYVRQQVPPRVDTVTPFGIAVPRNHRSDSIDDQISAGDELSASYSYLGPEMFGILTEDSVKPWRIQRLGFVRFSSSEYPPPSERPLEYTFCGTESWMRQVAAWHGSNVYTMPLSLDGRTFVLCDFTKGKITVK